MRPLAITRYRLWTSTRAATPIFLFALAPALIAMLIEARTELTFLVDAEFWLKVNAIAALVSWCLHGLMIGGVALSLGSDEAQGEATTTMSNLMDSAPVAPRERFFGEACGIAASTFMIHLCCLPLLVVVAALSPLPTHTFAWIETVILALLLLGSATGAWRRVGPRVNPRTMRALRTTLLFLMLMLFVVIMTTDAVAFRDAVFAYIGSPSVRSWANVRATVNNPPLMFSLFAVIYVGYLTYFYVSASRMRATS